MAEREREFRPLRRINRRIVGVLGWPYPILNAILTFFQHLREKREARFSKLPSSQKRSTYSNIEEYSIWEEPSGVIKVRVMRKAKRGSE